MNIIFDMDDIELVSEKIRDFFIHLDSIGHNVAFTSMQHCRDMYPLLDHRFRKHLFVGANGTITHLNGQLKGVYAFPQIQAERVIAILDQYQTSYIVEGVWNYSKKGVNIQPIFSQKIEGPNREVKYDELGTMIRIMVFPCENWTKLEEKLSGLNLQIRYYDHLQVYEITLPEVNKLSAFESQAFTQNPYIYISQSNMDTNYYESAFLETSSGKKAAANRIAKLMFKNEQDMNDNMIQQIHPLL
ncbi:HAD hydrolase family protein [Hazenella sp. IB182353]|uniref:HAD hydrolase family protein n=1 Tax=Polycladospora coralii TaxID=2771432 RepID=UPI001747A9F8|nr:HAD hydrolase family protein [Polycladospora coralii]